MKHVFPLFLLCIRERAEEDVLSLLLASDIFSYGLSEQETKKEWDRKE